MVALNEFGGEKGSHSCLDKYLDMSNALHNLAFMQEIESNFRTNIATIQSWGEICVFIGCRLQNDMKYCCYFYIYSSAIYAVYKAGWSLYVSVRQIVDISIVWAGDNQPKAGQAGTIGIMC